MNIQDKTFSHLLDTSAIVAYLAEEKGADIVARFKSKSAIPFIAMSELYYIIAGRLGKAEADRMYGMVKSWGLPILLPNERVILNAGRIKALYKLGIADSYISAFARDEQLILVTKDRDYELMKGEIQLHFLP
jgi:predicted nucleic acid-binding protein